MLLKFFLRLFCLYVKYRLVVLLKILYVWLEIFKFFVINEINVKLVLRVVFIRN